MFIWVNGLKVGYSQGSKIPIEWDITKYLQKGENSLAVEVYRWRDGSYLECQYFWRISGAPLLRFAALHNPIEDFDQVWNWPEANTRKRGLFGLVGDSFYSFYG